MREILVRNYYLSSAEFCHSSIRADLREHAIFTLHCLLEDNPENQAVVDAIQPNGQWDENGVLRDTPRAVRK
jgi:hypothetical protein